MQAQSSSELLQIDSKTLAWSQEKQRIDLGQIDALVVKIDHEDEVHLPGTETTLDGQTNVVGRISGQCDCGESMIVEEPGHVLGVRDADTKAQPARPEW